MYLLIMLTVHAWIVNGNLPFFFQVQYLLFIINKNSAIQDVLVANVLMFSH